MVLPGLGSWLLGRRTGLLQMVVAVAGFGLTSIWAFWFIQTWIALHHLPTQIGPHFGKACLGIALFFGAWLWSLGTSLVILRKVYGPTS
jgi:hypothetical protein